MLLIARGNYSSVNTNRRSDQPDQERYAEAPDNGDEPGTDIEQCYGTRASSRSSASSGTT